MQYFIFLLIILVGLWSAQGHAAYNFMKFRISALGKNQYDYSYVWNPATKEATLRLGLVSEKIDPIFNDKEISFASAKSATFVALDLPEIVQDCNAVSQWHFEYQPGFPSYLMFVTLRGAGCQWAAQMFDILQIRMRFTEVTVPNSEPLNVVLDISR